MVIPADLKSSENNLKNEEKSKSNNGGVGIFKNLSIKMNKNQLVNFYGEIEKIQESLDKLNKLIFGEEV